MEMRAHVANYVGDTLVMGDEFDCVECARDLKVFAKLFTLPLSLLLPSLYLLHKQRIVTTCTAESPQRRLWEADECIAAVWTHRSRSPL